jgi:hypothetical protein
MNDDQDDDEAWDALDVDDHDAWNEDEADDDEDQTTYCPDCGAAIYDDAVRCPHCGSYVTPSTHPFSGRPWWWIALGVAGIVAVILMFLLQYFARICAENAAG